MEKDRFHFASYNSNQENSVRKHFIWSFSILQMELHLSTNSQYS